MAMDRLNEALKADAFVGFLESTKEVYKQDLTLEAMFPMARMDGDSFSYIKTANSAIELTAPSALDAEPIAQNREGFDASEGKLPLFRKKMNINEKEKRNLKNYMMMTGKEGAIKDTIMRIYDDQATLITGAQMTMEFLRAKVLMDGKITMVSKGGAVNIDYKIPSENKYTLTSTNKWDNVDAKILDDIRSWLDKVEDETGERPARMVMNRKTFGYFRNNKDIRANLLPLSLLATASVAGSVTIADSQIVETIKAITGLTEIIVYNKKIQYDGKTYDLIEDNKVAIVPEGILGQTMIGTSPAEENMAEANASGANIAVTGDGIAVNVVTTKQAPYSTTTEIEFIGLPSYIKSNRVVLATVA